MTRVIMSALMATIVACPASGYVAESPNCPTLIRTYFREPMRKQLREFSEKSLSDQVQTYLCGNQAVHPPALYLAEPLARHSTSAVPFLQRQLQSTTNDATRSEIIYVFAEIQRVGAYDVAQDDTLMRVIESSVHRIGQEGLRDEAEGHLQRIRRLVR